MKETKLKGIRQLTLDNQMLTDIVTQLVRKVDSLESKVTFLEQGLDEAWDKLFELDEATDAMGIELMEHLDERSPYQKAKDNYLNVKAFCDKYRHIEDPEFVTWLDEKEAEANNELMKAQGWY